MYLYILPLLCRSTPLSPLNSLEFDGNFERPAKICTLYTISLPPLSTNGCLLSSSRCSGFCGSNCFALPSWFNRRYSTSALYSDSASAFCPSSEVMYFSCVGLHIKSSSTSTDGMAVSLITKNPAWRTPRSMRPAVALNSFCSSEAKSTLCSK